MEQQYLKLISETDTVKYYWSPAVRWELIDNIVKIEIFFYKDFVPDLFPRFYFLTQKGMEVEELLKEFADVDPKKVSRFIDDLIKKRILIHSVLTPHEVFFPQGYLFQNEYSEKIVFDATEFNEFKVKQLQRTYAPEDCNRISLKNAEFPEWISKRRSYRTFNTQTKLSYEAFSGLLSVFQQVRDEEGIRYYYASAGGLYPIDVYVYIKENRIESIGKGLYYYSPVTNSLNLLDDTCLITKEAHYFANQALFEQSACSIFFVYNAEATMPKYGGMAYFYACVDSGIMIGALTAVAELRGIGLCSIGDMHFRGIEKYFRLNQNQVFLHAVEVGLKLAFVSVS
jgi:SagB-type dehydrogenase family enzyme